MTSRSSMKLMIRMVPRHPRSREDKLRTGQGIGLPRSSRGQAPIFWISRARFSRYYFELLSASRMQGTPSSSSIWPEATQGKGIAMTMNPMAQNARTRFDPFIQEVFFAGLEQHQPGRA